MLWQTLHLKLPTNLSNIAHCVEQQSPVVTVYLCGAAGSKSGPMHVPRQLVHKGGVGRHPPQPEPRGQKLGKAVQSHYPAVSVQRQVALPQVPEPGQLPCSMQLRVMCSSVA